MNNVSVFTTVSKEEAIAGMREWNKQVAINFVPERIINYFKNYTLFELTTEEIEYLGQHFPVTNEMSIADDSKPKIHMYAGIENEEVCFYLIDSHSDSTANFENTILKKNLKLDLLSDHSLTPKEAKVRIERWNTDIDKKTWCNQNLSEMFSLIEIDYLDYISLDLKENEIVKNFLALKEIEDKARNTKLKIEIIAAKGNIDKIIDAQDFSAPRPPFHNISQNNYQLLQLSNQ